ncbi:MAG: hypothetical protein H6Q75_940 [Firmicutes bacterium]|nr:hypothetical protein [Bacillota bacterium]
MYFGGREALISLVGVSGMCACLLAVVAWKRRNYRAGYEFFFGMIMLGIYSIGYMFELASNTLPEIRFWLRVESFGIAFLPTTCLTMVLRYTGFYRKYWPRLTSIFLLLSGMTFVISNTSEFHQFYYIDLALNTDAPFPVVTFVRGPWYWLHNIYINLSILCSNFLYGKVWFNNKGSIGNQAFILFLGSLFPWLCFLLYLANLIPWGIDPNPAAFVVTGLLYFWGILGLDFLNVGPAAREAVFHGLADGILVFSRDNILIDFNSASRRFFPGLTRKTIGTNMYAVWLDQPVLLGLLENDKFERKSVGGEFNSPLGRCQAQRTNLYDKGNSMIGYMVMVKDISQFTAAVEEMRLQAAIDPLTGVWNRNGWYEEGRSIVEKAVENKQPVTVIIIDIDNFKSINDQHGHIVGDAVLQQFVNTCKQYLRENDIFGRYGGDEFIIILPEVTIAGAFELAEQLRSNIAAMVVEVDGDEYKITGSFGVAAREEKNSTTLDAVINLADKALYQAKSDGRNLVALAREF